MFMCPYDLLGNLVDVIVHDDDIHNNLVNSIIDTVNTMRSSVYNPEKQIFGIDMNILNNEMQLIIPGYTGDAPSIQAVSICHQQVNNKREFLLINVLQHIRNCRTTTTASVENVYILFVSTVINTYISIQGYAVETDIQEIVTISNNV